MLFIPLKSRFGWVVVAQQGPSETHICSLRLSFDANHLSPYGVTLPHHVLSQVQSKFTPCLGHVSFRDQIGICFFGHLNVFVQVLQGVGFERIRGRDSILDVGALEFLIECFVILFQDLCETRLVELNE